MHAIPGERLNRKSNESEKNRLTLKTLVAFIIALFSTQLLPLLLLALVMIILVVVLARVP